MTDGWFKQHIDKEAMEWREKVDNNEIVVVGINKYEMEENYDIPVFVLEQENIEKIAIERIQEYEPQVPWRPPFTIPPILDGIGM